MKPQRGICPQRKNNDNPPGGCEGQKATDRNIAKKTKKTEPLVRILRKGAKNNTD